jgi:hypothetical protein
LSSCSTSTNTRTEERIDMNDPMNELWRVQQDAATRLTDSWRTLLQPAAGPAATPPAPDDDDPAQQLVGPDDPAESETTDGAVEPVPEPSLLHAFEAIQALCDGQRDLAQDLTRWAERQHELADTMTAWATRQRDTADALDRILAPFSPASANGSSPASSDRSA